MPIAETQSLRATRLLTGYCEQKIRPDVRDKVRLNFRVEPTGIVLFEQRPRFRGRSEWIEEPIAKFRYVTSRREWQLYCQHADLKWHTYERLPAAKDFDDLLVEVEDDPTGIFWG
jgi:hypothetical protein